MEGKHFRQVSEAAKIHGKKSLPEISEIASSSLPYTTGW